jgi:hypothetical protein
MALQRTAHEEMEFFDEPVGNDEEAWMNPECVEIQRAPWFAPKAHGGCLDRRFEARVCLYMLRRYEKEPSGATEISSQNGHPRYRPVSI